jgi:hypothetical protein
VETKETKKWTPEVIIQAGKEIVTAVLGLLIVGYALYLATMTFSYLSNPTEMAAAKDVLLLILGLAGVVIGYYFGRVPADARAVQAQEQASAATAQAEKVTAQARAKADDLDRVMAGMAPAQADAGAARGAAPAAADANAVEDLRRIRDDLRVLGR